MATFFALPYALCSKLRTSQNLRNIYKSILTRNVGRVCTDSMSPRCPDRINDKECSKIKRTSDTAPKAPSYTMWFQPECCRDMCHRIPRYDDMYWKESDKNRRQYMQTWVDCPNFIIAPKICKKEVIDFPPMEKRSRKEIKKITECDLKPQCVNMAVPCPKFKLDNCHTTNTSYRCLRARVPTICKKYCTPYPAYSECRRKILRYVDPTQCRCLATPSNCAMNDALNKYLGLQKITVC